MANLEPAEQLKFDTRISQALFRIRRSSPFLATLALFARYAPSQQVPTAATDGQDVFFNPAFLSQLNDAELDGVLIHEVLHAAHLHVLRRSQRNPMRWNVACDISVNGILRQNGFSLPQGALFDGALETYSAEEIYELLGKQTSPYQLDGLDLLEATPADAGQNEKEGYGRPNQGPRLSPQSLGDDALSEARKNQLKAHWERANQQAATLARGLQKGDTPAGIERALQAAQPTLDWRRMLWRFLSSTPTDFAGFDRRHLGRGLYLDALQGQRLRVYVAIDTSGSVDNAQVSVFLGEVQGILRAYPHLECWLYFADAALYGPYVLGPASPLPTAKGGGGTDFRPFFAEVMQNQEPHLGGVCVYLTDGYGDFPTQAPEWPVLWVLTPAGLEGQHLPFGEWVRLV